MMPSLEAAMFNPEVSNLATGRLENCIAQLCSTLKRPTLPQDSCQYLRSSHVQPRGVQPCHGTTAKLHSSAVLIPEASNPCHKTTAKHASEPKHPCSTLRRPTFAAKTTAKNANETI